MKHRDKILIGLGIMGIVVAVWAALRGKSSPTVVLQPSPSLQPQYGSGPSITPLGAPPIDPYSQPVSAQATESAIPGTSSSGVPAYTSQVQYTGGGSTQQAPVPAANTPTFYKPIQSFLASMLPQRDFSADETPTKKDSCGCGGGCGNCADTCSTNNSRYPDGRGGCLSFNRKTQIQNMSSQNPGFFDSIRHNFASADIDMFSVFQQTTFDQEKLNGVPASPFLSPV